MTSIKVAEGVFLPDDIVPYIGKDIPEGLLEDFYDSWQMHHFAVPIFYAWLNSVKETTGMDLVPIPGSTSAYRKVSDQRSLFLERYSKCKNDKGAKFYEGSYYCLKSGFAQAASPGKSIHGYGLAVDLMHSDGRAISVGERTSLRLLGVPYSIVDSVKSENWHWVVQDAQRVFRDMNSVQNTDSFPLLRLGSRGSKVILLQNILSNNFGRSEVVADGIFGPLTSNAVKAVQQLAGLEVDGLVGPLTWSVLNNGSI